MDLYPSELSGGMQKRAALARAVITKPEIIFFDEATNSLDYETEKDVMRTINALKNDKTLVIIAHRLSTLSECDIVFKIEKGKISKST